MSQVTILKDGEESANPFYEHPKYGLLHGFLLKQGGFRKNWKRRWFSLSFDFLTYYDEKDMTLGQIPIVNCSQVLKQSVKEKILFSLSTPDRLWLFEADTESEMNIWMGVLKALIEFRQAHWKDHPVLLLINQLVVSSMQIFQATTGGRDFPVIVTYRKGLIKFIITLSTSEPAQELTKLVTLVCTLRTDKSLKSMCDLKEDCDALDATLGKIALCLATNPKPPISRVSLNITMPTLPISQINLFPTSPPTSPPPSPKSPNSTPPTPSQEIVETTPPGSGKVQSSGSLKWSRVKPTVGVDRNMITSTKDIKTPPPIAHATRSTSSPNMTASIQSLQKGSSESLTSSRRYESIKSAYEAQVQFQIAQNAMKESKITETAHERILKLNKEIRHNFVQFIETVKTKDKTQFHATYVANNDNFTLLLDECNKTLLSFSPTLPSFLALQDTPIEYYQAWRSLAKITKEAFDTEEQETWSTIVAKSFEEKAHKVANSITSITHEHFAETQYSHATELFSSLKYLVDGSTSEITPKIYMVANALVQLMINFFNHSDDSQETAQKLEKVLSVLSSMISDTALDTADTKGIPRTAFIEIIDTIRDFSKQMRPIVDEPTSPHNKLQFSASLTKIHGVLLNLMEIDELIKSDEPTADVDEDAIAVISDNSNLRKQKHKNVWSDINSFEDITYLSGTKDIHYASLNQLILHLTNPSSVDMSFFKCFLVTYRSFTTPTELLAKLLERFMCPDRESIPEYAAMTETVYKNKVVVPVQLRVVNLLRKWIQKSFPDLTEENIATLYKIHSMMGDELGKSLRSSFKVALDKLVLDRTEANSGLRKRGNRRRMEEVRKLARPGTPRGLDNEKPKQAMDLSKASAQAIAEQLTLVDFEVWATIKHTELLNTAWSKVKLKHLAPNVLKFIARFNDVSAWTASNIVWSDTIDVRVKTYCKFIQIAKACYDLNNFNSAMAILAGLNNAAVFRLQFTRNETPKKEQNMLVTLQEKLSSTGAYKAYRATLHNSNPPIVPYLGVYLTDLTFITDGNIDVSDKGLINFHKRRLEFKVLQEMEQYQVTGYHLSSDPELAFLLSQLASASDDELYALSLLREPRGVDRTDLQ